MKYIIMCGGNYSTFEKPRQLTEVKGEPLVARTIRLLRENGVEDISISSGNPAFEQFGVPVLKHDNGYTFRGNGDIDGYWVDAFYLTDEPTCYIFGDVLFSPEAIRTIINYKTDNVMLFGSKKPFAPEYPKIWREPFAYKVQDPQVLKWAVKEVKRLDKIGAFRRHPIAWELWSVIRGTDPKKINKHYCAINDYTCDIDYPEEVEDVIK